MKKVNELLELYLGISSDIQEKLLITLITFLILWSIHFLIKNLALEKLNDIRLKFKLRKSLTYTLVLFAFIFTTKIWFGAFTGLTTYLGLLSAGIAIAMQDPLVNMAAWLFLIIRRPFNIGDRI